MTRKFRRELLKRKHPTNNRQRETQLVLGVRSYFFSQVTLMFLRRDSRNVLRLGVRTVNSISVYLPHLLICLVFHIESSTTSSYISSPTHQPYKIHPKPIFKMKFLTLTTLTSLLAALTAASPLQPISTAPSSSADSVEIGDIAVPANTTALRAASPLQPSTTAPSSSAVDAEFGDVALNATRTLLPFGDKTALKPKQTPRLVVYTANEGDETCENGLAKTNKWKHAWYLAEGECHNFDTAWTVRIPGPPPEGPPSPFLCSPCSLIRSPGPNPILLPRPANLQHHLLRVPLLPQRPRSGETRGV